jgi:RNA recognition motif-containing protein
MPESPPASAGDVKLEPPNDQNGSQTLNTEDEQPAKRPRLDTDGHVHGPTLSSSYRPRKRPDPIPTHMSIPSPSPTTSSSSSSNFPSEHIVTPISSLSTSTSTSTNFQQNNHYRPTSSSSSLIPPISSFVSSWSDTKPSLPPPPPSTHALPPRPQVSLPPPSAHRVDQPAGLSAVPISSSSINPPRNDSTVKPETTTASTPPPSDLPSAEEIRRRADEVIARLMGTAPSSSPTTPAPAASTSEEGSLERKAEDVIARLEREARAREAAVLTPVMFRPPYPPYGQPGGPPAGYYPPPGMMRPPHPPAGWRPPVGYGPPPGWRPPGPTITRFPRPAPTLPLTHISPHLSPANRPPFLPPAVSPATSTTAIPFLPSAVSPVTSTTAIPSPITSSAPLPTGTPQANADMPILLPKKRKSESLEPPSIQPKPQNQVYIGNLPADTQLATLRKAFEALSPILTIELRAPYAMIEFEEEGAAQQAVEVYDEGSFGGVQIRVERASD